MICINRKIIQSVDYIFVDFFDTLMFRKIHSSQMEKQWDIALSKKLCLRKGILSQCRRQIVEKSGKDECAINYRTLCNEIWEQLHNVYRIDCILDREEFYSLSFDIETHLELGVQYINREMYNFLQSQKKNGKKIVLVTDFYLPTESYEIFGRRYHLDELLDYIYCSSDLEMTKSGSGKIYDYVLNELSVDPKRVLMIGDNLKSDKKNAQNYGMYAYRYFPLAHKIRTNLCKRLDVDCRKISYKNICKSADKEVIFGEYMLPLAYFTEKLYAELFREKQMVNFLSRGGYFLKILMDAYQNLSIPKDQIITTNYIFNSRKVNEKAVTDSKARKLLYEYLSPYIHNNEFVFVDEGWHGHGQLIFSDNLKLNTKGYYLGLMSNSTKKKCKRRGILFQKDETGKNSSYYGVFRTNLTLYEQILTAPHGSVQEYYRNENNQICVKFNENEKEQKLYEGHTAELQILLLDYIKAVFVWQCKLSKYKIAKSMLKSLLFANKEKRNLLKLYDKSYFNNVCDNSKKTFGHIKQVHINVLKMFLEPEEYMRYFCKIKEKCHSELLYVIYVPVGILIYCYCRISLFFKHIFIKSHEDD